MLDCGVSNRLVMGIMICYYFEADRLSSNCFMYGARFMQSNTTFMMSPMQKKKRPSPCRWFDTWLYYYYWKRLFKQLLVYVLFKIIFVFQPWRRQKQLRFSAIREFCCGISVTFSSTTKKCTKTGEAVLYSARFR